MFYLRPETHYTCFHHVDPRWCCKHISLKQSLLVYDCARSSLLLRLFSSCSEWGLLSSCYVRASHCGKFLLLQSTNCRAVGLSSWGSQALEHWLNSCGTWVSLLWGTVFPDQQSNLCLLHWQADSLPQEDSLPGKPVHIFLTVGCQKEKKQGGWGGEIIA